MMDVSLDIEACGEVVLSVGAVEFDPATGALSREVYGVLNLEAQMDRGLRMSPSAFLWWMKQDDDARKAITEEPQMSPETAIGNLRSLIRLEADSRVRSEPARVWAYPTSYDLPVLAKLCETFSLRSPWKWTETMDGRTLWKLACMIDPTAAKIEKDAEARGIPHHALADAKEQAGWYVRYLRTVLSPRGVVFTINADLNDAEVAKLKAEIEAHMQSLSGVAARTIVLPIREETKEVPGDA